MRALKEALLGFSRAKTMSVFAIMTTGFSLSILGLFVLVMLNLNTIIRRIENKVEVVVYLRDGADKSAVGMAIEDISRLEGVDRVRFLSKDDALERFRADLGADSDLLQDLEINPVPASLSITMQPGFTDTRHVKKVADAASGLAFVEEVDYGLEWLRRMDFIKHITGITGSVAASVLALVAIVLISSAIKIAIFSRQKEIFIMKIVGATNGYIRRSFLLEGFLKGTLGGLLASVLIYAVCEVFSRKVVRITSFPDEYYLYAVLAGALMGLVGSWISLGRYLKRV
ncbi:MAG: permease-like cell division protein FtsX [Gemmatimonadota bacterium]|nr:permease-like cell division protein FtsX [Gemmatimonadota bacterium]